MATVYRRGAVWWVRFQWNGREIRQSARTTSKSEARQYLAELQQSYRQLATTGRPRVTFAHAAVAYVEDHVAQKKVSTIASYQQSLRVLNEEFGAMYLDQITRAKIAAFEAKQRKRVSASKVKHYRAALSGLFKVALRHDWVESNPCVGLDPVTVNNARYRFLTPEEWKILREALDEPFRSISEVAIDRGMRLGEILALEWRDLNFISDEISMRDTKGNRPRVIPMEGAAKVFNRQQKLSRLVFHTKTGGKLRVDNVSREVNRVAREAGIDDFTFHDLRHTFASWYVQRGGDMYRLQRILGHKGPAMTQRYAHLRVDDLRELAQKPAHRTRDFLN